MKSILTRTDSILNIFSEYQSNNRSKINLKVSDRIPGIAYETFLLVITVAVP